MTMQATIDAEQALKTLSVSERINAIQGVARSQTAAENERLAEAVAGTMPYPSEGTRNDLWKIVIWAFAIVLVGSVLVLSLAVFFPVEDPTKGTKPDMILTVFTTVTAFLAGLFSPSPGSTSTSAKPGAKTQGSSQGSGGGGSN